MTEEDAGESNRDVLAEWAQVGGNPWGFSIGLGIRPLKLFQLRDCNRVSVRDVWTKSGVEAVGRWTGSLSQTLYGLLKCSLFPWNTAWRRHLLLPRCD